MHLAYVVNQFPALSETFVAREVLALRERGVRVDVYTFTPPSDADVATMSESMQALAAEAIRITPEAPSVADISGLAAAWRANGRFDHPSSPYGRIGRAVALAKHIRRTAPDRLHAHWPYATMVTHLASLLTSTPYSTSIHAHEVAHENGHFREAFGRMEWGAFCNRAAMEHLMAKLPPEASDKAHLVYHGVETHTFEPLAMPESADPFRVVSAGRLTETKGFDRLVRACALAREQGAPVELAILGRGDQEKTIRAVAEETGFSEHLSLPGWVSHDEVPEWIGRSHVFALPASVGFHDGLPNVVLESMASARPVILSPLPAAPEAVTPGVEGEILSSQDDIEGLASILVRMASEPDRVAEMGRAARARVVADHDARSQVERLHRLHTGALPAAS